MVVVAVSVMVLLVVVVTVVILCHDLTSVVDIIDPAVTFQMNGKLSLMQRKP